MEITVEPNEGWGNARVSNIQRLCENVALHFNEKLRDEYKINGNLTIIYRSQGPRAFYRWSFNGEPDEYKIGLSAKDRFWSQFAYQFGHEFCHILHNFDVVSPDNPNSWFFESLCELANVWVIRQMSKTWAYRAPYQNWIDYRHALADYAQGLLDAPGTQYSGTAKQWISRWEDILREDTSAFDYSRVSQLSYKFLNIFEEHPEAWNAIRQMPDSHEKMSTYMKIWYNKVDLEDNNT